MAEKSDNDDIPTIKNPGMAIRCIFDSIRNHRFSHKMVEAVFLFNCSHMFKALKMLMHHGSFTHA